MWLDIFMGMLLACFAWLGLRGGAVAAGMGLLTLAVAYGSAIVFAPLIPASIASALGVPDFLRIPFAGTIVFAAAFFGMALVSFVWRRRAMPAEGESRTVRDRFLGAAFGTVRGAFMVFLFCYLAIWVDVLRVTGTVEGLPEVDGSLAAKATAAVVEAGVKAALPDHPVGAAVARMVARPSVVMLDVQGLLENPHLAALREDRLFWSYIETDKIDVALAQRSFLDLSHDRAFRDQLVALGMIEEWAGEDPRAFRTAARDVFEEAAPRIRALRRDPDLQALMSDPKVVAMAQSGDTLGMITDPRFRRLMTRIASK